MAIFNGYVSHYQRVDPKSPELSDLSNMIWPPIDDFRKDQLHIHDVRDIFSDLDPRFVLPKTPKNEVLLCFTPCF